MFTRCTNGTSKQQKSNKNNNMNVAVFRSDHMKRWDRNRRRERAKKRRDNDETVKNNMSRATCRRSCCVCRCRWNQFYLILLPWWIYVCDNNRARRRTYCFFIYSPSVSFPSLLGSGLDFFSLLLLSSIFAAPFHFLVQKCVPLFCSCSLMVCFIILMMCLMHTQPMM